jgi:hypothetical protein
VLDDGRQVVRYCGDGEARIALTDGPHTGGIQDVKGAECRQRGEFLTANFGTNYSDEVAAQGEYVGLLLGGLGRSGDAATGVKVAGLEVMVGGKRQSLSDAKATASLKGGRLDGSLTGRTEDGPVTIEFHCATA